jgi:hypothetical protein
MDVITPAMVRRCHLSIGLAANLLLWSGCAIHRAPVSPEERCNPPRGFRRQSLSLGARANAPLELRLTALSSTRSSTLVRWAIRRGNGSVRRIRRQRPSHPRGPSERDMMSGFDGSVISPSAIRSLSPTISPYSPTVCGWT